MDRIIKGCDGRKYITNEPDNSTDEIQQLRSKVVDLEEMNGFALLKIGELEADNKKLEVENTMLIGEAEELKASVKKWQCHAVDLEYKCLDKNLANDTLSLQVAQLREALEQIDTLSDICMIEDVVGIALNTAPNASEWIKRSQLELEGYWKQGDNLDESDYFPIADFPSVDTTGCTPLYRIKGKQND